MARLSDDTVTQLKQGVSLTRLMETQCYEVKKHGQQFVICCPWHDDKTASLIITPATNLWHCKHCDIGGSNIDWIMKTQGVSFRFACEILMKDIGLLENTGDKVVKQNTVTRISSSFTLKGTRAANPDNQAVLRQVIDYYHQTFKQSPEVQEYLQSRGLCHPELVDHFKLGFANRTLGYQLPAKKVPIDPPRGQRSIHPIRTAVQRRCGLQQTPTDGAYRHRAAKKRGKQHP